MKKFIAILAACFACLAIAVFFIGRHYFNPEYIEGLIADASLKATGTACQFREKISVGYFPPVIHLGKTEWHGTAMGKRLSFSLAGATIHLEPWPLFYGAVNIREITLENPDLEITSAKMDAEPEKETRPTGQGWSGTPFEIGRLMLKNGKARIYDGQWQIFLEAINLSAHKPRSRRDTDIKFDFILRVLDNTAEGREELAGNLAFKGKTHFYPPNLSLRQAAATFTATSGTMASWFSPMRVGFEGAIDLDTWNTRLNLADVSIPQGRVRLKGEGALAKPAFAGDASIELRLDKLKNIAGFAISQKENWPFVMACQARFQDRRLSLDDIAIRFGESHGSGRLTASLPIGAKVPDLDGRLSLGNLDLAKYKLEIAASDTNKTEPPRVLPCELPKINLRMEFGKISHNNVTLANAAFQLRAQGDEFGIDDFSANWADGILKASLAANTRNGDLKFDLAGADIMLGDCFAQFGVPGIENGKTVFSASLKANGVDLARILATMNGAGKISSRAITIKPLADLVDYLPILKKRENAFSETVERIDSSFTVKNGVADFESVIAKSRGLDGSGRFSLNLASGYMDGNGRLKILGMDLPFYFKGPAGDVSMGIDPDYFLDIAKDWL